MADEVVRPQVEVPDADSDAAVAVPRPQPAVDTGDDPTIQRFHDGTSIQTFDDGSSLITQDDGTVVATEAPTSNLRGLSGQIIRTQASATAQDAQNAALSSDWRVRLSLAEGSQYLYNARPAGILLPLLATNGVIFPYTPQISIQYAAHYDGTELTHSNYKIFQYKNSAVDQITITCDFTAQDTLEANYLLAVIHFFRSVTKMFYGQDSNPTAGTPPPLCYLTGLGQFQFNNHPLVITNFSYNLPNDVDYIRATSYPNTPPGTTQSLNTPPPPGFQVQSTRAAANQVPVTGNRPPADFKTPGTLRSGTQEPTYVPTRIQLQISASPIVSRNDISNNFSVEKYATGSLLKRPSGGGIW
jgi:hypothetical protein